MQASPMDIAEEFAMSKFASSADRNAALLDEIERLRLDAARYRWLRDGCCDKGTEASRIANNEYGMDWDATIDAAMKG